MTGPRTSLFAQVACAGLLSMSAQALADDSTFQGLGGKDGIRKIVGTVIPMIQADPRIKESFADSDMKKLALGLEEQFCALSGGPCVYKGRDMADVHDGLNVTNAQFNALAEDLQVAMERQGVPSRIQNKLMARLAPIQRAIVTQAQAQAQRGPDMGKLTATGGVSQLEGAGGGGITPWALITGYGTRDSWGANAHYTRVQTQDYSLDSYGVAVGIADRVELSLAQQDLRGSLAPLDQLRIKQDIVGVKVKLAGDAVYDQDRALPQLAIGAMYKRNKGIGGLGALGVTNVKQLGAKDDSGVDYYLSATRILLDQSLLLNGTLRATRANQMGILGFGGDRGDSYKVKVEASAAYLLTRKMVAGVEYRAKPHNLGVDEEKAYYDLFLAWFPTKKLSVTGAYAVLGDITVFNHTRQRGAYLSVQTGF